MRGFSVQDESLGYDIHPSLQKLRLLRFARVADLPAAKLDVMGFRDPEFDRSMIKEIVLAKETKSLITRLTEKFVRSLVAKSKEEGKTQTAEPQVGEDSVEALVSTPWTADFVKGKGEGLIFLLHGKPGVGKTYTAGCSRLFCLAQ